MLKCKGVFRKVAPLTGTIGHAKALATLISETPFQWLSAEALDSIGVEVPDIRINSQLAHR
jgi:hypothetical protein